MTRRCDDLRVSLVTGVMVTIVMVTSSPSDECEEKRALCTHILDCRAPRPNLTT